MTIRSAIDSDTIVVGAVIVAASELACPGEMVLELSPRGWRFRWTHIRGCSVLDLERA